MVIQDIFWWILTISAIIGTYINTKKDRRCFYIWVVSNACFAVETAFCGAYNLTVLYSVYFLLAIKGIRSKEWKE
jgi:nicotinamide riboside transporter PnuC